MRKANLMTITEEVKARYEKWFLGMLRENPIIDEEVRVKKWEAIKKEVEAELQEVEA